MTVVERGDRLAPEIGHKRRAEHMDALDRLGVAVHTGLAYQRITASALVVRTGRGDERQIAADTVVVAGEVEPDTSLFDAVRGEVAEAHAIGDCTGLGLIRKATEEAARVATAL